MPNFQDTVEILKKSSISAFSICITVPLDLFIKSRSNDLDLNTDLDVILVVFLSSWIFHI